MPGGTLQICYQTKLRNETALEELLRYAPPMRRNNVGRQPAILAQSGRLSEALAQYRATEAFGNKGGD